MAQQSFSAIVFICLMSDDGGTVRNSENIGANFVQGQDSARVFSWLAGLGSEVPLECSRRRKGRVHHSGGSAPEPTAIPQANVHSKQARARRTPVHTRIYSTSFL